MANTEGLTDEVVSSMLTLPSAEEEEQQKLSLRTQQNPGDGAGHTQQQRGPSFPRRAFARREQLMELGEGEMPSATVIRPSKAPQMRPSSSRKRNNGKIISPPQPPEPAEIIEEEEKIPDHNKTQSSPGGNKAMYKPVILSDSIRERPAVDPSTDINESAPSGTGPKKRVSRFKQRNLNKNGSGVPTAGGFPSLDVAPVGAFTRKGISPRVQDPANNNVPQMRVNRTQTSVSNSSTKLPNAGDDIGRSTASMLANMSLDEIRDGVEEVTSILSAESIAFLRKRGQQKAAKPKQAAKGTSGINNQRIAANRPVAESPGAQLTKLEEIQQEENKEREEKEKMAELLSSVRTPEDMDRVYKEALQLGLAAELPSSSLEMVKAATGGEGNMDERVKNLHIASSLLRSTAPRQRLLGARSLCDILEQDVREFNEKRKSHSYSDSHDDRESMKKTYPKLLPVAIRCLLDESVATFQTAGGRMLLSIVLRCIHALMTLCVHPYHVVNINPASSAPDDPFVLYQTSFMSDVSHIPPGTELYPPTQIKPLDGGDATNASCYRADSSAASAESDSKSFDNDPAWTMLSRMRILPCISDMLCCLSTDYATGNAISEATIQSICGILALLAVRSPGAAGAIARHKGILPFLMSYCLSPSNGAPSNGVSENKDDVGESLFNTGAALPALILLCTLARQSRDIAELEMPFQEVIPDLQAILCVEAESCEEEALQMWSIILLRIFIKYGVAIEHVQLLINIAAPRVELMKPETKLGAHYLQLFANICDASKMMRQKSNGQNLPSISEADDCLAMAGVWLSSSARSCAESLQSVLQSSDNNHTKLASAQLRLLASYISTATPTMEASSIPIISKESCLEVIGTVLESNMFDNALNIALGASFNTNWDSFKNSNAQALEEGAIACSFVCSFMDFVRVLGQENLGMNMLTSLLTKIISSMKQSSKRANGSLSQSNFLGSDFHPGRKSWFVESEFSVLTILCAEKGGHDSIRHMLSSFGYSLLGRLNIGHEAMAVHILRQDGLFQVTLDTDGLELSGNSLQTLFLRELSEDDRKLQSNHSSNIYPMHGLLGFNMGSFNSLRCTADIAGQPNSVGRDKFLLPLGGIWMWNILSSTTTSQSDTSPGAGQDTELLPFVSQTLGLLLQIETVSKGGSYSSCISDGAKLYHLTNTCLFSDEILSNGFVNSTIELLYKKVSGFNQYTTTRPSLVKDFVKACFEHSRLSKEKKKVEEDEKDPNAKKFNDLIDPEPPSSSGYSKNELRALDDFVDDLCNSYIEYGGQYTMCTKFIRLFLRHDFPSKVISNVLTKLHPIVNLLTIEDEERSALLFSLTESISGGLTSSDSSQRDPSSVLDSFAFAIKKRDKELCRNDYVYLLAVGTLSRNFASSSQRCESGLEAMKNRLSGVSNSVFYDIAQVSQQFLSSGIGTKDSLIMSVMDVCINSETGFSEKDDAVREDWQWNSSNADDIWERTVAALRNVG